METIGTALAWVIGVALILLVIILMVIDGSHKKEENLEVVEDISTDPFRKYLVIMAKMNAKTIQDAFKREVTRSVAAYLGCAGQVLDMPERDICLYIKRTLSLPRVKSKYGL